MATDYPPGTKPVEPTPRPVGDASYDFYKRNDFVEEYRFGPSMARQEFREECDINSIMAKYQVTGMLPANVQEPVYYDFTCMPSDLLGMMDLMDTAEQAFMSLPAVVRKEFENSPYDFVMFASDPANIEKMREWGLAAPAVDANAASPIVGPVPAAGTGTPGPSGSVVG